MTSYLGLLSVALMLLLPATAGHASDGRVAAPFSTIDGTPALGGDDCAGGVVKDDGTLETGYGWVPSAIDGRYVQRFEAAEFRSRKMEEICVCWARTRPDDEISFVVELYRDRGGRPARSPEASVEAVATLVPAFPEGAFYSIDVSDADMHAPTETFYLGVRWNPSEDEFFFVCVDQTETTEIVDGFFVDDRASDWTSVLESNDPIFDEHRAMMIRARAVEGFFPLVPTLGRSGVVLMAALLAGVGALLLRRGR
jgi:hypothetical protein